MKNIKTTLALAMLATTMLACQQDNKNTYTIKGTATGFAEGETLLLVTNLASGKPSESITVGRNGKFQLSGPSDSIQMFTIYEAANEENMVQFFNEPGNITLEITKQPGKSHIAGSKANDGLQAMIEAIAPYGEQLHALTDSFRSLTEGQEEKIWELRDRANQLYTEQALCILDAARKNIDNELGFYLITQYRSNDPEIDQLLLGLIDKMPEAYQQRPIVDKIRPKTRLDDFTMATPDGKELSIMAEVAKNKVTLIDFWASWCGPCRQEMPFMVELYDNYKSKGLGIVGISLDNDGKAWRKAIADLHITWPQMSDLQGWKCAAAQAYHVSSIPHIMVVDAQGNILTRGLRGEMLEQFIEPLLRK